MKVGWVWRGNAFFICFGMSGHHLPHPRRSLYTPPVETPAPSAPGMTTQHRQQGRPRQMQDNPRKTRRTDTHARTLDTLHRSALDTRQAAPGRSGRRQGWRACSVSGKVYNFGRLFLSIFIWIYFAESIDNPYIYGYNIISPDKYGLQPQYTKTGGQKP